MRFGAAVLFFGCALMAIARETRMASVAARESAHARGDSAPGRAPHATLIALPLSEEPPRPATEGQLAPPSDPTRAAVLALIEVVDDDTRDALLQYYVRAGYPPSDLPGFSRSNGRIRLSDDLGVHFRVIASPGEMLLVDPASRDIHNLHGAEVNFAVPVGHYDVRFEAPRDPGLYRYRCDVHGEVLGWVLVVAAG